MTAFPHPDDTIAALASAPGSSARGIIRVSGPRVVETFRAWFVPDAAADNETASPCWFERRTPWSTRGTIRVAGVSGPLAVELALWPGQRSYTGQPLAELHLTGSPPLLEAVLSDLFLKEVRPAQPGEFTLRAFLSGRLDLVQAEAVLGVIDAQDRGQLKLALDQLGGGVSSQIVRLRGDLLDLLADLEAGLDFTEEDIQFVSHAALVGRIGLAREAIGELLQSASRRLQSATRRRVVLAGPPNAGKSTLFNALLGRDAALVSDERGTTRDFLTAETFVEGLSLTLVDTAGSEPAADPISVAAQELRSAQLEQAELTLRCVPPEESLSSVALKSGDNVLIVRTKADIRKEDEAGSDRAVPMSEIRISATSGQGLAELKQAIAARLSGGMIDEQGVLGTTAARCRDSLSGAAAALDRALAIAREESDQELLAIELHETLNALGKIVGAVYTDDVLDRIFSKFCIGK